MKSRSTIALALLGVSMLASGGLAEGSPVKLDTIHSRIGFTASTQLFDVVGQFKSYELQVDGDVTNLTTAQVKLTIDARSIDTDNTNRDMHLAGANFLDADRFPHVVFTSQRISQAGNTLRVTGTLTIHGQQRDLTIPFKIAKGKNEAGMDATTFRGKLTINRKHYGVGEASVAATLSLQDRIVIDLLIVWLP